MKNKSFVFILIVAFFVVIFGAKSFLKFNSALEVNAEVGNKNLKKAPDFTLLDLDGGERSLSDFKGKVIILDFWATWCPPCRAEIPHFVELYNDYKDEGLEVIGVSLDNNAKKVIPSFSEQYKINYVLLIADKKVTRDYGGIGSIPTTFIIDRDGNIVKKYVGYRDKEVFEKDIKNLL